MGPRCCPVELARKFVFVGTMRQRREARSRGNGLSDGEAAAQRARDAYERMKKRLSTPKARQKQRRISGLLAGVIGVCGSQLGELLDSLRVSQAD
jgi:hypothetical protein